MEIILHRDNGSLPDPYYYSFDLVYFQDASAHLQMFKGREDTREVLKERKSNVDPEELKKLSERIVSYNSTSQLAVGGGQRIITFHRNNQKKAVEIYPDDSKGMNLFNDGLSLFDPKLETLFIQLSEKY